ncbi:MAG: cation:proton antiporter [Bdellovibrionales bacterium]|nr:cation:proton antiporter [Bdellovibrionales bacterium]
MTLHTPLQEALVFLGATVILVPLFLRLGLGTVLGYLTAGSLIGPQILGWVANSENVRHYSEFGVVFLLFMIGLELQPKRLWSLRKTLLGFGGLQIVICTVAFFLLGKLWDLTNSASFVIGFSLALSSTAFALQTLTERKVLNTQYGRSAFAVLLMQDVAAIPALAIIPTLGVMTDSVPKANWLEAGLVVVGLVLVSRFVMTPFLRLVANAKSRELFTGVTLLIVMGVAFLMLEVGLSMALGAFIAGVLLSESEFRHELEADLEPFKGLLMGLFFISVGMAVNWKLFIDDPAKIAGLVLLYMVVKGILVYGVGRLMRLNADGSRNLAVYLVQGGEFAFVIFGVGEGSRVLSHEASDYLTLIVTLSMILSPFVILVHDKLDEWRALKAPMPKYDDIEDNNSQVIIAGFGRFGQIFGRILRTQEIPFTAIDHDSTQIELLRRFSQKVYFGDASRAELLESAGAKKAKFLVIAVDDTETALNIARVARDEFPNLKIFARARNRQHVFDLKDLGVHFIQRETFESSLALTKALLLELGFPRERSNALVDRFRTHDLLMVEEQYKVRHDEKVFIDISRQGAEQLARVLREDIEKTYIETPSTLGKAEAIPETSNPS